MALPSDHAPVRVGVVGAGPWATMFHAPLAASGPETTLSGIWARRPDAAAELAAVHATPAFESFDELLAVSDAIAFAVPPDVQAEMAVQAAEAGKALLLDKPLALDVTAAERVVDAVDAARVGSIVVFTMRFAAEVRQFVADSRRVEPIGAQMTMVASAFLSGPFSNSPWRHERGALMDLGPHAIDLVTAALGPAAEISSRRSRAGWVSISIEHESGSVSDLSLCGAACGDQPPRVTVWGRDAMTEFSWGGDFDHQRQWTTLRSEFAAVARSGAPHECDARRGLQIQRWLADADG
jgi:predicted dehydrogenase